MNTIRYNTNSTLIQRFQRNERFKEEIANNRKTATSYENNSSDKQEDTHQHNNDNNDNDNVDNTNGIEQDPAFISSFPKNSIPYLKELCLSIYPKSIHKQINELSSLNDGSLEFHSLLALIVKNFIKHWYGPKIYTDDPELIETLFKIFYNLTTFIRKRNGSIDMIQFLLNDVPVIIYEHIDAVKQLNRHYIIDSARYEMYCNSLMIENDRYPFIITDLIKYNLSCASVLQNTFLDSLFNQFLLGRILDTCCEPYYFLRMLIKVSDRILDEENYSMMNQNKNYYKALFDTVQSKISKIFRGLIKLYSNLTNGSNKIKATSNGNSVMNSYLWTLITINILSLDNKRPLFYICFCYIRHFILLSKSINQSVDSIFIENLLWGQVLTTKNIKRLLNSIRTLLFPNDNLMGPNTIIPTGEEFESFKLQCINKLIKVMELKKLDSILGVTQNDIKYFIDIICQEDKKINKILLLRIIDCFIAHLTEENSTSDLV